MFSRPPENFLYSAYQLKITFSNGQKEITGTGTAFLVDIGNKQPWIVTNKHVLDLNYRQVSNKYKEFKLNSLSVTGRAPDDSKYTIPINLNAIICYHNDDNNDIAMIQPLVNDGVEEEFHFHFGMSHIPSDEEFKQLRPFDVVCFSGFPATHDKLMGRPILRSGRISSDPQYDYSWDEFSKGACVAYEGFSTEGASGSPVFANGYLWTGEKNNRAAFLVGINGGHIPEGYGHSGISYFYKSTLIREIIQQNKLIE